MVCLSHEARLEGRPAESFHLFCMCAATAPAFCLLHPRLLYPCSEQVACSRCGQAATLSVCSPALHTGPGAFTAAAACTHCSQPLEVLLRPRFVHDSNNTLGVIKPVGCVPRDLLPSIYAAQCGGCSTLASLRDVQASRHVWGTGREDGG